MRRIVRSIADALFGAAIFSAFVDHPSAYSLLLLGVILHLVSNE